MEERKKSQPENITTKQQYHEKTGCMGVSV